MHRFVTILLILLASISFAQTDFRQWEPSNGIAVRMGSHIEFNGAISAHYDGPNNGESALVWSDTRRGDRDIYIQIFNQNGEACFEENGSLVNGAVRNQIDPVIAPSSDGGWLIAWVDFQLDSLGDITCTKIDADGRVLWGDTEQGVRACSQVMFGSIQRFVNIESDGNGGCYLVWEDTRDGDPADLYAQRILENGQRDANWPEDGRQIIRAAGPQHQSCVITDCDGGIIVLWRDGQNWNDQDLRAQRLNPTGQILWAAGGVVICNGSVSGGRAQIATDFEGGAFIVWSDMRNLERLRRDIYAQRINSEGAALWTNNGVPICALESNQDEPKIISTGAEAIISWIDSHQNEIDGDIYAMKVTGEEECEMLWDPPTGVPISVEVRSQAETKMTPNGSGGAYFVWSDDRRVGFPEVDVYCQNIDDSGEILWAENGIPICAETGWLRAQGIVGTAGGGCMVIGSNLYGGVGRIFGQRLDEGGNPEWEDDGRIIVSGFSGNAYPRNIIQNQDGSVTICWMDARNVSGGWVPYLQTISQVNGAPVERFAHQGIPVTNSAYGFSPVACSDGENGTLIAWEGYSDLWVNEIRVQKSSSRGEILWPDPGILAARSDYEQRSAQICSDERGGVIVSWNQLDNEGYNDIFIQRISADGDQMWGVNGIQVVETEDEELLREVFPDNEGGVVIFWSKRTMIGDPFDSEDDIYCERFDSEGERLWGEGMGGIPVVNAARNQRQFDVAAHPDGWMIAWEDDRDDLGEEFPGVNIYGQFINLDGTKRWQEDGSIICGSFLHQANPKLSVCRTGDIWIVWEDWRAGEGPDPLNLYMQKIDPAPDQNGNPQILFVNENDPEPNYGIPLTSANGLQIRPVLVNDGGDGLWVLWDDYRNSIWGDVYGTHLDWRGSPFEGWDISGNVICNAYHRQGNPLAALLGADGEDGLAVVWQDCRASGEEELTNIFIQRVDDDAVSVKKVNATSLPTGFEIVDVYPNPFNSRSIANYTIPTAARTIVSIIDANGREVIAKNIGWQEAGRYRLEINGAGLPSGSYKLILSSGNEKRGMSLVLIK